MSYYGEKTSESTVKYDGENFYDNENIDFSQILFNSKITTGNENIVLFKHNK